MPRGGSSKRGSSTPRGDGKPSRGRGGQRGGKLNRDLLGNGGRVNGSGFRGFSMADEARETSQHTSHWDSIGTLRSKPVSFVSAGPIEPLKELETDLNQISTEDGVDEKPLEGSGDESPDPLLDTTDGKPRDANDDDANLNDASSIIGPEELERDILRVTQACQEPSTQEAQPQFFFDLEGDRRADSAPKAKVPVRSRTPEPESSSSDEVILFKGRDAMPIRRAPEPVKVTESTTMTLTHMEAELCAVEADLSVAPNSHRGRSRRTKGKSRGKRTDIGQRQQQQQAQETDDDAAIIADYLANMRENGEMSDLVASQGSDTRNTRDLGGSDHEQIHDHKPERSLSKTTSEKQKQVRKNRTYESGSELDDATLAKLLQGHVPGTEEETFDGFASSSDDSSDINDGPAYGQGRQYGMDIDEFDVMDWSRPSLGKKKKSKASRAQMIFDVSDDDLQEALQMAWSNDRLKKSERKKQREELRALGMLGKNASKPEDLRVKYSAGMDINQVGEEIKIFLKGGAETLSMPPMDTHARKIIHEIASKFRIKSKSTGKADQRRTSLYRTKRTLQYSEASFEQAIARIHRRFLPRLDTKGKRGNGAPPHRASGRAGTAAAASYQEGEVVGAAAPELGAENRGRAMLEKMGWSTGTALGAMDNKGILQPVPQTMKKSKAGLG